MIPLYILGLLQRFGPQHGYQLKKLIAEQLADFTQIKLPTLYYHLEKMAKDGLIVGKSEKSDSRPAKTVYTITDEGIAAFKAQLHTLLDFQYRPTFESDGLLYFSDYMDETLIASQLATYIDTLSSTLHYLRHHRDETLTYVPESFSAMVTIIFSHHIHHYEAELNWARETQKTLTL
ncbi:PadR family transcriptional regulator [Fusibacter paucivorans]|uniref:PadR family transcriptional regulator n=1 Tax=Fusibacter paucivorans TaxID=76009 RepID=A0ABS5PRF5_9FIRM|nr:PadR family transcriptional regulator [Fusibacter paucivorans]MBS7527651.1 PadR family transcriptional regulator [Fusibacter paucivorans]